jgi:hypothetical protein
MNFFQRLFGQKPAPVPKQPSTPPPPAASPAPPAPMPEFPFPLQAAPGSVAVRQWRTLQAEWRKEGCSAVLLGDAKEVKRMADAFSYNTTSVEKLLETAKALKAFRIFRHKLSEIREYWESDEPDDHPLKVGEWPTQPVEAQELGAHRDVLTRKPKETVYFAKIPTVHSFEIPAYLQFGGWNDCPSPEEHVAMLRRWSERYGLEIYAITGDVMECELTRLPVDRKAALNLAREQYLYCSDIVDQGVGNIATLAAILGCSTHWYFWWD